MQIKLSKILQHKHPISHAQRGEQTLSKHIQNPKALYFATPSEPPTPGKTNSEGSLGWVGGALGDFKSQKDINTAVMPIALETKFPLFKSLKHFCTLYIKKNAGGSYKIVVLDSKSSFRKIKHFLMRLFGVNHLEGISKTRFSPVNTTFKYHSYGAQGLDQLVAFTHRKLLTQSWRVREKLTSHVHSQIKKHF